MNEKARIDVLGSIEYVNGVIVFDESTPNDLIQAIKPDVIVKGGDYVGKQVVGHDVARVEIATYDGEWSTTKIIEKIRSQNG
jgi:D-beta-D-heptose 7-phosphate kinase/D-beta-D-heptose 1-phosphate adenosyltransferase